MATLKDTTDRFGSVFGESRGRDLPDGVTPADDAALRHVIWHGHAAALLLREQTYEYARVALSRLRRGESRDELWRDRSAPGGVVFTGAFAALRDAGLYPAADS